MPKKIPVDSVRLLFKIITIGKDSQKTVDDIFMRKEHKCLTMDIMFFRNMFE